MLEVKAAEYAGNYAVHLVFSNGRAGTADLEQLIFNDRRPVFARLRERASFSSFKCRTALARVRAKPWGR